jgi:hypothetical protein
MLITGMRDESIGVDSPQYANRFSFVYDISWGDLTSMYEPIYQLTVNFVNSFTSKYGWWFLLMSVITFTPIAIAICSYSKIPLLSVLVYMVSTVHLFPETMNIMRQSVAISFLLLSYIFFSKNKKLLSGVLFLVAFGFHFSSVIVIPFYFLCKINIKRKYVISALILTFIIGIIGLSVISSNFISNIFFNLGGNFETGIDKFNNQSDIRMLNIYGVIMSLLPINILCYLLLPSQSDDKTYKYLFNIFFCGVIISNLLYSSVSFGFRYSYPFFVVESLLFANKYKTEKRLKPYLVFIVLFYCFYLWQFSVSDVPNMIIPYSFNKMFFN